jgi:hypothetical protein
LLVDVPEIAMTAIPQIDWPELMMRYESGECLRVIAADYG